MNSDPKILVLIDSNAIIHRSYHALPKTMTTRKGEMTNAVYGYTTTLVKVLEDLKPDYIAASFDLAGPTFRHVEFKEYKATRIKADQELYDQIPRVKELLNAFGIPIYEKEGFEADDVIGTISDKFEDRNENQEAKNFKVYIITGDKDAFQLVDGNIYVYNLKGGLSQVQIVDREAIKKDWGLDPEDFIDLKALAGDPSDNIPGVPGVGGKTATDLLIKFDSLKNLYEVLEKNFQFSIFNFQSISNDQNFESKCEQLGIKPRIVGLLIEHKDQAFLSQRLATIRRDVSIDFDLEKCRWGDYDKDKVREFFAEMQFNSLLKRFGVLPSDPPKTVSAKQQKKEDSQLKLI